MEALVRPGEIDAELRLLVELPAERPRAGGWAVSLIVHAAAIAAVLLAPPGTSTGLCGSRPPKIAPIWWAFRRIVSAWT